MMDCRDLYAEQKINHQLTRRTWPNDDKSEVRFEKHHLVDELKLKMAADAEFTFSISALTPGVAYQIQRHFCHLWTLCQQNVPQIFERRCINKDIV